MTKPKPKTGTAGRSDTRPARPAAAVKRPAPTGATQPPKPTAPAQCDVSDGAGRRCILSVDHGGMHALSPSQYFRA